MYTLYIYYGDLVWGENIAKLPLNLLWRIFETTLCYCSYEIPINPLRFNPFIFKTMCGPYYKFMLKGLLGKRYNYKCTYSTLK